ncbi:hypothetical protein Tco_1140631, partial [Tanacetum coccineum]
IEPELDRGDLDRELAEMVSRCKHTVDAAVGPLVNGSNQIGLVEPM